MRKDTPSKAYAQAAYESATDEWLRNLTTVQAALDHDPDLLRKLRDPGLEFERKQKLAEAVIPEDAPQKVRNFVSVLLSRNDIALLPDVIEEFRQLAVHGPRARIVKVTSALPLTDDEKETLVKKLTPEYGANLAFEYEVDPSLLGGLVLRIGDRVIDASVAGKLQALREQLVERR